VHTAIGVGYGLERFAMVRFGIDDIRKIDVHTRGLERNRIG
jgi:phenylalanyl-tRNA synthetase alpha subunit